jgi:uncharacterized repeat protein (TIGR01451 family)
MLVARAFGTAFGGRRTPIRLVLIVALLLGVNSVFLPSRALSATSAPTSPITVTKSASAASVASGGQLTYTINVTNTGGAVLKSMVLTDQVNGIGVMQNPPALPQLVLTSTKGNCTQGGTNGNLVTCNAATLNGGETWTVTIGGQVTAPSGTTLNNTASVSGTKSSQSFTSTSNTTAVSVTGGTSSLPDLTINKTGPTGVAPGDPIKYTLTVNNIGTANATNIKVVDTLPNNVDLVSVQSSSLFVCTPNSATSAPVTVTCTGGAVNAGQNATITINGTAPTTTGTITNTAAVDPDNTITEANELNNTSAAVNTSVSGPAAGALLDIKKTDGNPGISGATWTAGAGPDPVNPGQTLVYKIQVTNNATGNNSRADYVTTTDSTQGLEAASITASQTIVNGTVGNTGGCVVNAPQVTCSIKSLNSGGTQTITISGKVIQSAGSSIFNTATVTGNIKNTGVTNTASEVTTVRPAVDLTITKGASPEPVCARSWPRTSPNQHLPFAGGTPAASGSPTDLLAAPVCLGGLTYDFVVGNSGITDVSNVTVRDPLPAGTIFDSYDTDGGFQCAVDISNVVTCTGGTVPKSDIVHISFVVVAPPALGTITNTATVDPNNAIFEPDETNNTASVTTTVATGIDLTVWKGTANDNPPGDTPALTPGSDSTLGDGYEPIATRGTQTYTIYVDNVGTQDSTNIRLRDTLPADTVFLSVTADHGFTCSQSAGIVECVGGHLLGTESEFYNKAGAAPGAPGDDIARIRIRVFAPAAVGTMHNEVRIDPNNEIPEVNEQNNIWSEDNQVTTGDADKGAYQQLKITKTQASPVPPAAVATNGILIYDLKVENAGTDPVSNAVVRDTLPAGTRYILAKDAGTGSAAFNCSYDGSPLGGVVTCTGGDFDGTINTIAGVGTRIRHITIKVFAPNTPGTYTNQATVDPNNAIQEGNEFDNDSQADTTVAPCNDQAACTAGNAVYELKITKTQDSPANNVARNAVVTYLLKVENYGSDSTSGIVVTDTLPEGARFIDAVDMAAGPNAFTCGAPDATRTLTCTGGVLDGTGDTLGGGVGQDRTIKVRAFAPDTPGNYTNRSAVDPANAIPEGNEFNNASSVNTVVENGGNGPFIDLTIDKTQEKVLDQDVVGGIIRVGPNDPIKYLLKITNKGSDTAFNVRVRDVLPAGTAFFSAADQTSGAGAFACGQVPGQPGTIDCTGGTIPGANGTRTIVIFAVAPTHLDQIASNQGDIKQTITNTAMVDPDNEIPEGDETNNVDSVQTLVQPRINLTVVSKDGPTTAQQNQEADYVITVKNAKVWGNGAIATDAHVVDSLPVGLIPLSVTADASNMVCQTFDNPTNYIDCVGDMEVDQTVKITVHVFITASSGTMYNQACIDPNHQIDETDELDNCQTKTTNVNETPPPPVNVPDLLINKTADTSTATAGQQVTYTVTVSNVGNADAPTGITMTDTLPSQVTFINANATNGFTCSLVSGNVECVDGSSGLAVGQNTVITILVKVNDGVTTAFTNSASVNSVTGETNTANNGPAVYTINGGGSSVDLQLVSITDSPDPVNRGSKLTYTIVAVNNGTSTATGAIVRIQLPQTGIVLVGADGSNGFNCAAPDSNGVMDCVGDMPAGGNTVITVTAAVELGAPDDLTLTATIDPTGAFDEIDEGNNAKTETTTVSGDTCTSSPCIDLVAAQIFGTPAGPVDDGTAVKYTFVVVNVGDTATTGTKVHIHFGVTGNFTGAGLTAPTGWTCTQFVNLVGDAEWFCDGDLAAGAGQAFELDATASGAGGSITATGEVDPHHAVTEFIETNNGPISTVTTINS